MFGGRPTRLEWYLAASACAACALAGVVGAHQAPPSSLPPGHPGRAASAATSGAAPPTAAPSPVPPSSSRARVYLDLASMGAATTVKQAVVRARPSATAPALSVLRAGIVLPIDGLSGTWLHVTTPCEVGGWVRSADLQLHPRAPSAPGRMADAVFVIDPGHGGFDPGAIGPTGLREKDVNLSIARRVAADLEAEGARVYLTRNADYTAGLHYRARLASALGATAFVSIHNNSAPTATSPVPGTQAWHQVRSPASEILASLVWRTLFDRLKAFHVPFARAPYVGPLVRLNDKGWDYYAVLRESRVPAVIVESLFISNRPEEALLKKAETWEVIARAVTDSMVTFVAGGVPKRAQPYEVKPEADGFTGPACVDPR